MDKTTYTLILGGRGSGRTHRLLDALAERAGPGGQALVVVNDERQSRWLRARIARRKEEGSLTTAVNFTVLSRSSQLRGLPLDTVVGVDVYPALTTPTVMDSLEVLGGVDVYTFLTQGEAHSVEVLRRSSEPKVWLD